MPFCSQKNGILGVILLEISDNRLCEWSPSDVIVFEFRKSQQNALCPLNKHQLNRFGGHSDRSRVGPTHLCLNQKFWKKVRPIGAFARTRADIYHNPRGPISLCLYFGPHLDRFEYNMAFTHTHTPVGRTFFQKTPASSRRRLPSRGHL